MDRKVGIRIRINDISEIYDGKNLLIKDFSNLDLSDINLSMIPMEMWENCIFYNTNLKNTKIRFIPSKLRKVNSRISVDYCDFSDNDLSYLEYKDFCCERSEISTYGCNFRNTKVNCLRNLYNIELDISCGEFDKDHWGTRPYIDGRELGLDVEIDIETLKKNPFLNVSSARLFWTIWRYCQEKYYGNEKLDVWNYKIRSAHEPDKDEKVIAFKRKVVAECESFLELDKEGYAKRFYNQISKNMTLEQKWCFFTLSIIKTELKDIDLTGIPIEILNLYEWHENKLINVTIDNPICELMMIDPESILDIYGFRNSYEQLNLTSIKFDSWQENITAKRRISSSFITFFTKVYLELSRDCNARCPFCRNTSFDKCSYDLEKIKNTLFMIKSYINAVVIGGGEPTLRLDDVKKLRSYFENSEFDWHLFTNGTNPLIIDDDYIMDKFRINLSRHAISDSENASIFGFNSGIMSAKDIERLNLRNGEVTLNATCFNGGLDSVKKILEYINFAKSIGCKKVLIQNLQNSASLGSKSIDYTNLCINPNVFEELIEILKSDYKAKYPIYATGGYVSHVFKNGEFSISVQKYISPQELEMKWTSAIKRTFDLSINPSGELYENLSQTAEKVRKLKKVEF